MEMSELLWVNEVELELRKVSTWNEIFWKIQKFYIWLNACRGITCRLTAKPAKNTKLKFKKSNNRGETFRKIIWVSKLNWIKAWP